MDGATAEESKYKYGYALLKYLEFCGVAKKDDLYLLLEQSPKVIETNIIAYIRKMRSQDLSYSTQNSRLSAIVLFYTMNDIVINRKKIGKFLGEHIKTVRDRAYTISEIHKIVDVCDLKYKVFVLLMASTGCRLGAIPPLKLHNLKYYEDYKLYQITFYENTKAEYYSFCTPECAKYIDEYIEYRRRCGEPINANSPLIRDDFIIDDLLHIKHPRHLTNSTFKFYIRNKLIALGFRTVTPTTEDTSHKYKKYRTEIAQNHGFRKFTFTTMALRKIDPEVRELLVGHKIGLSGAYYRPTENQMLNEYLKVVNDLTISSEYRLKMENEELKTKLERDFQPLKEKLDFVYKKLNIP
jgi:integrase